MPSVWNKARKRRELYKRQKGRCAICGKGLSLREATFDHIIPKSYQGTGHMHNLRLVHSRCNQERGNEIESVTTVFNGYRVLRHTVFR